jgi:CheY-like chemotaxis protein
MIDIRSEPGQGTSMRVFLQQAQGPAVALSSLSASRASVGGSETLLLVEDEPELRHVTARQLEILGYQVLEAQDGQTGLDRLLQTRVDLVVTDMVMPRLGGIDLFRRARAQHPGLRFIFCSGYSDRSLDLDETLESDTAVGFLAKPFALDELSAKVREILDCVPPGQGR